jgi:predicted lipoprotein with Yx(FWY)xxD motif
MRKHGWAVSAMTMPALAGAALLIAACGSSAAPKTSGYAGSSPAAKPSSAASATVVIDTRSTSIGTVLTNAQGFTLYWFAIDTPTTSKCYGTCASYWPPLIGKPVAGSGASLPKGFSTITRSNGQLQATYDGHPLYTYEADTSAGMTTGNGSNLSGGLWWAMTPSGAKPSAATAANPSPSSTASGGGW